VSEKSSNWLVGCGIGCGAVVLIIAIIIAIGYFAIKDTVEDFKEVEASTALLEEKYGRILDFCPEPKGTLSSERIEAFLLTRQQMESVRLEMEETLGGISDEIQKVKSDDKRSPNVLKILKKVFGSVSKFALYYKARNEALLATEMGLGEYQYMYVTVFYSYLGKSPGDGPPFPLMEGDDQGIRWQTSGDEERDQEWYEEEVRADRLHRIAQQVRRRFIAFLSNQLEKLNVTYPNSYSSWKEVLKKEISDLESDRNRIPWQDGLPNVIKRTLEPYRERLEESYAPLLNPLEMKPDGY
jgi:hypothetical protein